MKKAADAAGRKICFMGMSLTTYLEAAWRDGRAPFDPRELVSPSDIADHNPNEVLVVCTGSQVPPANLRSFETAGLSLVNRVLNICTCSKHSKLARVSMNQQNMPCRPRHHASRILGRWHTLLLLCRARSVRRSTARPSTQPLSSSWGPVT